jgi:DNA-binding transcriptional MerR regulator
VNSTAQYLNPSEAAKQLGVSTKALRLYEERGLLKPLRTAAGWRAYGSNEMTRATEIVELRGLGLSLAEVAQVLDGEAAALGRALAAHEAILDARARALHETILRVRKLRGELDRGTMLVASVVSRIRETGGNAIGVAFDLPWPWGGERFEIPELRRLTCITGPLGSGKTSLAMRMAEVIPGASFVGEDRLKDNAAAAKVLLAGHSQLEARVRRSVTMIVAAGGNESDALLALFTALETEGPSVQVINMLEEGLDMATQEALICFLRRRAPEARQLIFLTRSSSILDVDLVGPDETIILCPANHSPPMLVAPYRGTAGYEALTTCLAAPDVRARTAGVVAMRHSA